MRSLSDGCPLDVGAYTMVFLWKMTGHRRGRTVGRGRFAARRSAPPGPWARRLRLGVGPAPQGSTCARRGTASGRDRARHQLPDGEGFSLLETLRGDGAFTPVIVMTARGGLDDRLRGLNGGADDYIAKPFAVPELIARIHAVVRRTAGQASAQWSLGALHIDTQEQTVAVDGSPVDLTPTEYKLLLARARSAGRIVGREELIRRVWGDAADGSDAALDYQVHSLRRKLGSPRITTRRGVGFRLEMQ